MRNKQFLAVLILCSVAFAPIGVAAQQQRAAGPTMEETKAWLETEGHGLMHSLRVIQKDTARSSTKVSSALAVDGFSFTDCALGWTMTNTITTSGYIGYETIELRPTTNATFYRVLLADVSPEGMAVQRDSVAPDSQAYQVNIPIRDPDSSQSTVVQHGIEDHTRAARLPVESPEAGQRIVNALKHAAQLCNTSSSLF